jgi:hypothetical protein
MKLTLFIPKSSSPQNITRAIVRSHVPACAHANVRLPACVRACPRGCACACDLRVSLTYSHVIRKHETQKNWSDFVAEVDLVA